MLINKIDYPVDFPFRKEIKWKSKTNRATVPVFVMHEACCTSEKALVHALNSRGLDVHLAITPDATVVQYEDLCHPAWHACAFNKFSIGCEICTPYYPKNIPANSSIWTNKFSAAWAHKGWYTPPSPEQLEAMVALTRWLLDSPLGITNHWPAFLHDKENKAYMKMGPLSYEPAPKTTAGITGIWAHHHTGVAGGNHSDGAFPVLYTFLRLQVKLTATEAYKEACRMATACTKNKRAYFAGQENKTTESEVTPNE